MFRRKHLSLKETLMNIEIKRCRIFAAMVLLGSVSGCGQPTTAQKDGSTTATAPAAIAVVHPKRQSLRRVVEQPGAIQAHEESQLFGRIPGFVSKVHFDIGQSVLGPKFDADGREAEPGQVLAEISAPELEEEVSQKNAQVRQAKAEVEQSKKALASAEANIVTTEAMVGEAKALYTRWASESKRITELVKNGVIDAQTRDETTNQFKAAEARVQSSEATVQKAKADRDKAAADVATAEARVSVAEADARRTAALMSYAKIRAPFDGIVTRRKLNVGDFVQPVAGKADYLFSIARLDPVRIVVAIPEADAEFVREKSEVKLSIPALSNPLLTGTVTRTSWALEPGSRTLRAEIELPNRDGRLRPGMYVSAQIINSLPESWTLPSSAITKHEGATVCFLIESGKAVRTVVRLGRTDGQFTEVLGQQTANGLVPFTGTEKVAARASGIIEGQTIESTAQ
jgi:HlyD family secretion protein